MKTVSLVLLLVASALAEDVKPVAEVKEVKEVVMEPEARALAAGPLGVAPFHPNMHQFGARINSPYYQPNAFIQGAPAQAYMSGSPFYHQGAVGAKHYQGAQYYQGGLGGQYFHDGAYHHGAAAHFVQPASVYHSKKVVQPTLAAVRVNEYERFAAPAIVKAHPAGIPAHIVKAALPVPAAVGVHPEYERFAAPGVVRAHAAPAHIIKGAQHIPNAAEPFHVIVKQANDDNFDGSFAYSYETDHGISVESTGFLKNAGTPDQIQVMQGSYTYYTPEGVPIVTTYIADENGFQVQGDHLPVPPPMPEAIAKSIEYQRSLPPSAEDIIELERAKVYAKF